MIGAGWILLTLLLSLAVADPVVTSDLKVTLNQGTLVGKYLESRLGRKFLSFQGIPYAAPPVGELRFKPPQPGLPWLGERDAKQEGNDCIQFHPIKENFLGSEDCLFLNVYTPRLQQEGSKGLPVMVWVHGGGFSSGSGSTEMYGPQFFLDQQIVLVTFNYRIGALGFFSLGTKEVSGNYGLKDQMAALRWVKDNIAKFGGDPESVTIFGESAGGVSVNFLMLSPLTKGLFHRAIAQSGVAFSPWAYQGSERVTKTGQRIAEILGCVQEAPEEKLACLRAVPAEKLVQLETRTRLDSKLKVVFFPIKEVAEAEGAFLTKDPRDVVRDREFIDVPFMTGLTTREGMLEAMLLHNRTMEQTLEDNKPLIMANLPHIPPTTPEYDAAWVEIKQNYLKFAHNNSAVDMFFLINSDSDFLLGTDELVRKIAALRKNPVYMYQFSYDGTMGLIKKLAEINLPGTAHFDDVRYMFQSKVIPSHLVATPADLKTIERITRLWANFAKTSNPTPDDTLGVEWLAVEGTPDDLKMTTTRYLDIGNELEMKEESLSGERVALWWKIAQKYDKEPAATTSGTILKCSEI